MAAPLERVRHVRRIVVDRMDPFQAMSDEDFTERFPLPKETIHSLIQHIQHQFPVARDKRGSCRPIPYIGYFQSTLM